MDSSALDLELISSLADVYQTSHNGGDGQPQKCEEASIPCIKLLHALSRFLADLTGHERESS